MHFIESIVSGILLILVGMGFMFFHFIPLVMSIKSAKYLKDKEGKMTDAVWFLMIFSSFTALIFLYFFYYGLTCGHACFNGMFFIFSLFPALVFLIINQLYRNYISKDEKKLPRS